VMYRSIIFKRGCACHITLLYEICRASLYVGMIKVY
jgi:hypothetical protein